MDAVEFIKEQYRMCFTQKCRPCEIYNIIGDMMSCDEWCANNSKRAVEIVEKWSQEHPQKTMMQDFFEKYPNAPKRRDGAPILCPDQCGYEKQRYCVEVNRDVKECSQCWSRPMEE